MGCRVVDVGRDPYDIGNLLAADEPEQIGNLELAPARRTAAVGERFEVRCRPARSSPIGRSLAITFHVALDAAQRPLQPLDLLRARELRCGARRRLLVVEFGPRYVRRSSAKTSSSGP